MKIVVCIKHVPDAQADRAFRADDTTTDRDAVDGLLSELDEYAVEEAMKLAETHDGEVAVLTLGPDQAADAVRKSLQMGVGAGYHVNDPAVHGSDAVGTSLVLATALAKIRDEAGLDLVLTGMASTDGGTSLVPAMVAERLGLPQVTFAAEVTVDGDTITVRRDGDVSFETIEATLPAVVSVTDQINEPRYPSFKGIMAAKKKPVTTWGLSDLGLEASDVGLDAAWTRAQDAQARPPRQAGEVITDDGDGGARLAQFLVAGKFV